MSITIWKGETTVSPTGAAPTSPDVAVLSTGQYVVVWVDVVGGVPSLLARVYQADGTPAANTLSLLTLGVGSTITDPAVTGLEDGRFAVTYVSDNNGGTTSESRSAVFETDGTEVFSNFFTSLANSTDAPDITAIGDDFFVTVSRDFGANPDNVFGADYRDTGASYIFNNNFVLNDDTTAGFERQSSITTLANGTLAVAYVQIGQTFTRTFGQDGTFISDETVVGEALTGFFTDGGPEITALANGGYVITYAGSVSLSTNPFRDGFDVYAQVFAPNGDPFGDAFLVNTIAAGQQANAIVTETSDGGFIILYSNDDGISGRLFDGFGTPQGGEFALPVGFLRSDIESLAADTMDDGRIVISYAATENDVINTDTLIHTIIIDPRGTTITGTNDGEILYGSFFDDAIIGLRGDDELRGMEGRDQLFGGLGNDIMNGGGDADFLDGGAGFDTADYSQDTAAVGIRLDGVVGFGSALGDVFVNIEAAIGSDFNDTIVGSNLGNVLRGGLGNDTIFALDGNDSIIGGAGNNTLYGQNGNDTFFLLEGVNDVKGGSGSDTVNYAGANSSAGIRIDGFSSFGSALGDVFDSVENVTGTNFNDILVGSNLGNVLRGGLGNDTIYAQTGADTLIGGDGNDTLFGQGGSDQFVFADNFGFDRINDFSTADVNEQISLAAVSAIVDFIDLTTNHLVTDLNGDAVIVDGGNSITLTDVSIGQLEDSDFLFV